MARKSKQRKWELDTKRKSMKARRTDASRDKRLANKKAREEIHAVKPTVKITMKNGIPYNESGHKVEIINGMYRVFQPITLNNIPKVVGNKQKRIELGIAEDEHAGAEELAKHDAELGAKVGRQIDDAIEKQRLYAHKQLEERSLLCRMCGKVRESIQTTLCEMCAKLQANEDELRRKDHERASRPREATKVVKKGMFDVIKDKLGMSDEG